MGRRAIMTEAQVRRFIRAARAEDPRSVVEIATEAGTVRIMPEPDSLASPEDRSHDSRKPIPWT